ncbi:MAG TPA: hypothetical protein ENJ69_02960 [Bacteroidetes bacterium]|nr:hypothetical protein [Bacteroidota bacterium]
MIKALSVILSLVILMLSAVPCNDQDDLAVQQTQTLVISIDQPTAAGFDICNPFFFCHTGHSAFVQSESFFIDFQVSTVRLFSENPVFTDVSVYHPVWHPPKKA